MDYNQNNILDKPTPYKILRHIHLSDGGSYHVQIEIKSGIDGDTAEDIIKVFEKIGLLYQVDGTDPQLYDVNYSAFEELWNNLWTEEIADVPTTPVHFGSFLEEYIKSYLKDVEQSSIREMLVKELLTGMNHEATNNLPKDYEEMLNFIEQRYERNTKAHLHVRQGFNSRK